MSYEVEKFINAKREDWDDDTFPFDREAQEIFRLSRINSDLGRLVQSKLYPDQITIKQPSN